MGIACPVTGEDAVSRADRGSLEDHLSGGQLTGRQRGRRERGVAYDRRGAAAGGHRRRGVILNALRALRGGQVRWQADAARRGPSCVASRTVPPWEVVPRRFAVPRSDRSRRRPEPRPTTRPVPLSGASVAGRGSTGPSGFGDQLSAAEFAEIVGGLSGSLETAIRGHVAVLDFVVLLSSASAITFTSLSTHTGTAYEAKCPRTWYWSQPGMIGGATGRPDSNSTGPGTRSRSRASARQLVDLREALLKHRLDPAQHDVRPRGDVRRLARVCEDRARQVDHRDVDARRAEVGDEEVPGRRAEAHGARRPPTRRRADLSALEEAARDELADPLDDDGAAQARGGRELRARRGTVCADVVEDRREPGNPLGRGGGRLRRARAVNRCESGTFGRHFHRRP